MVFNSEITEKETNDAEVQLCKEISIHKEDWLDKLLQHALLIDGDASQVTNDNKIMKKQLAHCVNACIRIYALALLVGTYSLQEDEKAGNSRLSS